MVILQIFKYLIFMAKTMAFIRTLHVTQVDLVETRSMYLLIKQEPPMMSYQDIIRFTEIIYAEIKLYMAKKEETFQVVRLHS